MTASADPAALGFGEAVTVTDDPVQCEPWREEFGASAAWVHRDEVQLPRGSALEALCHAFGFPDVAVGQLVSERSTWDEPAIRRLGAHVQWLIANRYTPAGYHGLGWPVVFSRCPLFYACAALGLARQVAAVQAHRGIDPSVTRATLRDIGQQVYLHHRVHARSGPGPISAGNRQHRPLPAALRTAQAA